MNFGNELSSKLLLALLALALLASPVLAQGNGNGNGNPDPPGPPAHVGAQVVDRIPPFVFDGDLRDLPLAPTWRPGDPIKEIPRRHYQDVHPGPPANPPGLDRDPLLRRQEHAPPANAPIFATPGSRIAGQGYSGVNPPDTVGDIGANYYIQAINDSGGATFVVYDKTTGSVAAGPITMDSLGSGNCANGLGDPVVLYDHLAGRWMISEFSSSGNRMCVYVSQTGNPISGGWYNYDFTAPNFPDYPKYAVWPDAYYVTSNESGGPAIYALERAEMLTGGVADMQRFTAPSLSGFGFQVLTPGDLDGPAPPAGSPGYMIRHRDDEAHNSGSNNPSEDYLEVFEFDVDWNNAANSTFTGPLQIAVAEFDSSLCGLTSFSCIPQPGTSTRLDPLREPVMWRAQYRNFGSYETLVGSLATDVNGSDLAGVRWFELRRTGGNWFLQQEGTYSIDSVGRFMSSTAMDGDGNIASAYNVSSSSVSPGLRYAGRFSSDPAGTFPQGEFTLRAGSASNGSNRYGDYSSLNVDPVDNCTFWFTGEYNTSSSWSTWIDSFTFDGCGGSTCGNGTREGGEVCDGSDLGGATCVSQGCSGGGTLACNGTCDGFDLSGCFACGNTAPVVTITAPADGSGHQQGTSITFSGTANDAQDGDLSASLAWTSSIDGSIGSGASFSTSSLSLGSHTITAEVTDSGSLTGSDSITVNVTPEGGNGPQTATYDGTLGAPRCSIPGSSCDSVGLLDGRDGQGPEPNQPNTLDTCTDGTSGTYHSDESNDRIVVSTLDGADFTEGATVEISATVWAWTTPSSDALDLYYAADANNPTWVFITTLTPSSAGANTLTAQYTLPGGALQAVRANFRYQGSASSCSGGSYDDADDLVFAVNTASPCTVNADCDDGLFCNGAEVCNAGTCEPGTAPNCSDGVACTDDSCNEGTDSCDHVANDANCDNGLFCDGAETCNATLGCQAGTAPNCNDGVGCTDDSCNEGTDQCDNVANDANCDDGLFCNGAETCNATLDCQAGSDPCPGQTCNETGDVCEGGGGPQDAVYDAGLGAPRCSVVGSECDSVALLDGRGTVGPEPNQPNTVDTCTDGSSGTYHSDESNDRLVVKTLDGSDFVEGATVQVDATVYAYSTGTSDHLDLYYAADATNPVWQLIGTINPSAGGVQTLSAQYTLPAGTLQAVRANFRYNGSQSSCSTGSYDDADDLVFAVNPGGGGGSCTVEEGFESGAGGFVNDAASTCTTGAYVQGNPTNAASGYQIVGSHTGSGSLFTAVNTSAGVDDVDGGNCILGSPTWSVTNASTLSVWYWHGQRDAGDDASGDFFLLEYSINGGSTWTTLASNGDSTSNPAWLSATASIPAGSNVKLRVQCSDGTPEGDLVECGIDDVSICE